MTVNLVIDKRVRAALPAELPDNVRRRLQLQPDAACSACSRPLSAAAGRAIAVSVVLLARNNRQVVLTHERCQPSQLIDATDTEAVLPDSAEDMLSLYVVRPLAPRAVVLIERAQSMAWGQGSGSPDVTDVLLASVLGQGLQPLSSILVTPPVADGWQARLDDRELEVTGPDGTSWYVEQTAAISAEWRGAAAADAAILFACGADLGLGLADPVRRADATEAAMRRGKLAGGVVPLRSHSSGG